MKKKSFLNYSLVRKVIKISNILEMSGFYHTHFNDYEI